MPGAVVDEATKVLGVFLRDTITKSMRNRNFRIMAPDELTSNRLGAVLDVSGRAWMAERKPDDDHLAPDGRSMEILSEHTCQGWLEGYLLTGRHGLLTTAHEISWRRPIASLNYLLTSHVWRQDHNGFSHQDPGFIDHVVNKKADV